MPPAWQKHYQHGLNECLGENPDYTEAIRHFSQSLRTSGGHWEPLYARAWARLQHHQATGKGSMVRIERDLERVLEMAGPMCPDASAQLAVLSSHRGDHWGALEHALRAFGRVSSAPVTKGNQSPAKSIETLIIDSVCEVLSAVENADSSDEALERCAVIEAEVRAASLPSVFERSLLAEVAATRVALHRHRAEPSEVNKALTTIRNLSPNHSLVKAMPDETCETRRSSPGAGYPTFDEVGGVAVLDTFQAKMKKNFDNFFHSTDVNEMRRNAARLGERILRTVLMHGPSGCGKTYMVRAFAGEYEKRFNQPLSLIELRLNEIFKKYVGESEQALTERFDQAERQQPSLLFIDEIDALGGSRDSGQDWRTSQTSHLLQEIDRLQDSNSAVLMIGATNRIWQVELALVRRFDQLIPVELPRREVRLSIIANLVAKIDSSLRPPTDEWDFDNLATLSHGLTPGDLANVMRRAKDRMRTGDGLRPIGPHDLEQVLQEYGQPIHVRTWVQTSIESFHRLDMDEQAEEIRDLYAGYIDRTLAELGQAGGTDVDVLEPRVWREPVRIDTESINRIRSIRL